MIAKYQRLSQKKKTELYERFVSVNNAELEIFKKALLLSLLRKLESVIIIPTHGIATPFAKVADACSYITGYDETNNTAPVLYYEIIVRFTTKEEYSCRCKEKAKALEFLNNYI